MKVLKTIGKILLALFVASAIIFMTAWSVSIVMDRDKPVHENCTHFEVSTTILSEPLYENNEPDGGGFVMNKTHKNNDNPIRNASGCLDLTAHNAIENLIQAEDRRRKIFGLLYRMAELCGFHFEELVIRDNVTGKVWR